MPRLRAGLMLAFIFPTPATLWAQQNSGPAQSPALKDRGGSGATQPSAPLTFKSTVNRVIVDVIVTDSEGKPVPGLAQGDFSISEDGKPQSILTFDVHDMDVAPAVVAKLPPVPLNTFVNIPTAPERGPLYVLLLDLVNTDLPDQAFARQELLKFVKSKPEGTRFAVFVLSNGLHLVQGFTSDRNQLFAALDPEHPRPHCPRLFLYGRNYGRGDRLLMSSVLTDIARYLDGLPGRKNVIWLSGWFPVALFAGDRGDDTRQLRNEALATIDFLTRSEAALYPVNLRGVVVHPEGSLTGAVPHEGAQSTEPRLPAGTGEIQPSRSGEGVGTALGAAHIGDSLSEDYLLEEELASVTGGHAFYSTNDIKDALDQATDMGAHYYTLTYSPSNTTYDGKLRSIHVALAQKGYHLEYRRGYYARSPYSPPVPVPPTTPGAPPGRPIGDSLYANMQHGAPEAHQVFFRAHVQPLGSPAPGTPVQMANLSEQPAYFRLRKKNRPAKPLAPIQLQTFLLEYTVVGRQPNLEVAAAAYDDEGVMLNGDVENASSSEPGSSGAAKGGTYYRILQRIDVPVKAASIRVAVRDMATDHIGSLEFSLPLAPDPSQASLPASTPPATVPAKPN